MSADRSQTPGSTATSNSCGKENQPENLPTLEKLDCQTLGQTEPDLLYLNILNEAVEDTPRSSQPHITSTLLSRPKVEQGLTPRNCLSAKLSQLDDIDREYFAKKGVFDLPPSHHLDTLVKLYFDRVHAFTPVISRADFIRRYQSGDCSLLLLRVMLTTASLHAPADVLFACGFASRSAAQESFFSRARQLYDFPAEEDPLLMLQASIVMCMVILDHPTDHDFGYWFHNAVSLATKLNLRNIVLECNKPREDLKLYRKIWWTLCSLDVFHVFVDLRRSCLLERSSDIKPLTEDDWEAEDVSGSSSGFLSAVTPQQKAFRVVLCEMSQIFGERLSSVKGQLQQDPSQMMQPVDTWRKSSASKMHVDVNAGPDVCYLTIQAMSYRYECILCRLIRRASQHMDWREWAKQRLRSAILELDMIATRVLASGTLEACPIPLMTTFAALLALHIESALDTTETSLIRSMSRISISQMMLILIEGREIPALKRALRIFEEILNKNNLSLGPSNSLGQSPVLPPSQDNSMADTYDGSPAQIGGLLPQMENWQNDSLLDTDFLTFDGLDQWQQILS